MIQHKGPMQHPKGMMQHKANKARGVAQQHTGMIQHKGMVQHKSAASRPLTC
jgi:hypothetical protein